jgi:hypothetical protein
MAKAGTLDLRRWAENIFMFFVPVSAAGVSSFVMTFN